MIKKAEYLWAMAIVRQYNREEEARMYRRMKRGWQDQDRTYTNGERQLDQRLDCAIGRLVAAFFSMSRFQVLYSINQLNLRSW
jgi:hypothetical protein